MGFASLVGQFDVPAGLDVFAGDALAGGVTQAHVAARRQTFAEDAWAGGGLRGGGGAGSAPAGWRGWLGFGAGLPGRTAGGQKARICRIANRGAPVDINEPGQGFFDPGIVEAQGDQA